MHVRWLELVGFRNYASLNFTPDPGLNVLVGPNGHGKTSLLEGLHLLLAGRSFRTPRLAECVAWDAAATSVTGEVAQGERRRQVRLTLRSGHGELQGTPCPWARAVTFAATDVALAAGAASTRRAYLDAVAAKLVPPHAEACRRYRLVLQQRARLLEHIAGRSDADRLFAPWDEQAATLGSEILHRRLEVLGMLADEAREIWQELNLGGADIEIGYAPALAPGDDVASTRRRLLTALAARRGDGAMWRMTLVGPHRDDVSIRLGRADARSAASRGEQRLLALTLRLAEAGVVRRRLGTAPVFLLDDLLSEFDLGVCERVLGWLATQGQVLFSTTDAIPRVSSLGTAWKVRQAEVGAIGGMGARGAA